MRRKLNQSGDTIIEVLMAVAITSTLLVGALAMTNRSYRIGQAARERSQATNFIQQQAEAVHNFRNNRPWSSFVTAMPVGSDRYMSLSGGAWTATPCTPGGATPCLRPGLAGNTGEVWVHSAALTDGGNKMKLEINATWQDAAGTHSSRVTTFVVNLDGLR